MPWHQRTIAIAPRRRGFHPITTEILAALPEISDCRSGLLHLFLMHTSASLAVSENADPDVPLDLEASLGRLAPEDADYRHRCEGPDDMPAHVKNVLLGCSLTLPVGGGSLILGTWQGVYLCEHRNRGGSRRLTATLWGESPRQQGAD
jgi:secondary thiamine-phosphate synthase enzyme